MMDTSEKCQPVGTFRQPRHNIQCPQYNSKYPGNHSDAVKENWSLN